MSYVHFYVGCFSHCPKLYRDGPFDIYGGDVRGGEMGEESTDSK